MPQEFQILKCFSCEMFQVHIVKKANKKWSCKMCGEKQSTIKIFGAGSAKDCRLQVQKLNLSKGTAREEAELVIDSEEYSHQAVPTKIRPLDEEPCIRGNLESAEEYGESKFEEQWNPAGTSKWAAYLDSENEIDLPIADEELHQPADLLSGSKSFKSESSRKRKSTRKNEPINSGRNWKRSKGSTVESEASCLPSDYSGEPGDDGFNFNGMERDSVDPGQSEKDVIIAKIPLATPSAQSGSKWADFLADDSEEDEALCWNV